MRKPGIIVWIRSFSRRGASADSERSSTSPIKVSLLHRVPRRDRGDRPRALISRPVRCSQRARLSGESQWTPAISPCYDCHPTRELPPGYIPQTGCPDGVSSLSPSSPHGEIRRSGVTLILYPQKHDWKLESNKRSWTCLHLQVFVVLLSIRPQPHIPRTSFLTNSHFYRPPTTILFLPRNANANTHIRVLHGQHHVFPSRAGKRHLNAAQP